MMDVFANGRRLRSCVAGAGQQLDGVIEMRRV